MASDGMSDHHFLPMRAGSDIEVLNYLRTCILAQFPQVEIVITKEKGGFTIGYNLMGANRNLVLDRLVQCIKQLREERGWSLDPVE